MINFDFDEFDFSQYTQENRIEQSFNTIFEKMRDAFKKVLVDYNTQNTSLLERDMKIFSAMQLKLNEFVDKYSSKMITSSDGENLNCFGALFDDTAQHAEQDDDTNLFITDNTPIEESEYVNEIEKLSDDLESICIDTEKIKEIIKEDERRDAINDAMCQSDDDDGFDW